MCAATLDTGSLPSKAPYRKRTRHLTECLLASWRVSACVEAGAVELELAPHFRQKLLALVYTWLYGLCGTGSMDPGQRARRHLPPCVLEAASAHHAEEAGHERKRLAGSSPTKGSTELVKEKPNFLLPKARQVL